MSESTAETQEDSGCIDHTDEETLRRLYWGEGMSALEIADRSDVTSRTIYNRMDEYGIERRDAVSAKRNFHKDDPVKLKTKQNGYTCWTSYYRDKGDTVSAHRLLAVAEYGFDEVCGKHVHHKNNIPWDNRPENLEVLTQGEHMRHHKQGEKNHCTKLTESEVRDIKRRLQQEDISDEKLAEDYDVTYGSIGEIRKGNNWSHIEI